MASQDPYPSPPSTPTKVPKIDSVLRNALRYTVSAKEYEIFHAYLISRSPRVVRKRVPQPPRYNAIVKSSNGDYNAAAIRASLRVFVATQSGLKLWDLISSALLGSKKSGKLKPRISYLKSPNFRLSLSLSLILLLHRLLYRFFSRLRSNLLTKDAAPFRRRNPRVSKTLTSRLAPAMGASLAGFALGVYPGDQLRVTIAIYIATRAAEFAYNALEQDGYFKNRPWWWGSWMLMPFATGQLLHAFVFDRDCFPKAYGDFIMNYNPNYVQKRPETYPSRLPWPSSNEIVNSLASISKLHWPPFTSPILHPSVIPVLPTITSITSPAHPSITHLSCALLHPQTPSCLLTNVHFHLTAFPALFKYLTIFYTVLALPKYTVFLSSPLKFFNTLFLRVFKTTTFLSGAIGTAWGSICLFQYLLPRAVLPQARWFWGGWLAGLWAFVDRRGGRPNALYSIRMSIDSLWKVGVKRRWWKGFENGDLCVFVLGLALVNLILELRPGAIRGETVRKGVGWVRGEGWVRDGKARAEAGNAADVGEKGE